MAEDEDGLIGLQGLHQDLLDLEHGCLHDIDRLWASLESRIHKFRQLLDKPSKNEQSRKTLLSGTITFEAEGFMVNQEFQESATQLADALDLDELQSAQLLVESQQDAQFLAKSNIASAVILFHERRQFLLECLRLLLRLSADSESDSFIRGPSGELVATILSTKDGPARNGSLFAQKCLDTMVDVEKWLQNLGERRQGAIALGQTVTDEHNEIIDFQQKSLGRQHESLGAIINYLIKASRTGVEDFVKLLAHLPKLDRWSNLAVHYVPAIMAFAWAFGSPEGGGLFRDARMLNSKILDSKDTSPWILRNLQAATITWWLAEYSGWYLEQPTGSPVQNVNFHEEARHRSDAFGQALRDGAFECTLSICSQVTPNEWYDPAKQALIQLLLRDAPPLAQDLTLASAYFQTLLMEHFETFTDAFITNMPDTLRHFKVEEDEQRKRFRTNLQQGAPSAIPEQIFHLERFLVIVSFAFDHRADAAQAFWFDVDSNLYGFLQWASKRQSTPSVSAFCEMFRSISSGEECAASAHRFLLDETTSVSTAKIRRAQSLSWVQIFGELNIYTAKIREQPTVLRPTIQYGGRPGPDEIDEPESSIMLESYLRLTSHLCRESPEVRLWILSQSDFPILEVLLYLCNSGVPTGLQACAFTVIQALLTDKSLELSMAVWSTLDLWVSGGLSPPPNVGRPPKASPARPIEQATLDTISGSFDTANEFVALLHSLVCPAIQDTGIHDQLSFPESLGSSYRMSGIEPYVDFVFDKVFASTSFQFDDRLQQRILSWNVLRFAAVCLHTFNEDLVVLANRSSIPVDEAMNTSSLTAYVRLHPFARVMEWMFNERVLAALFGSAHHDIDEVADAPSDSPLMLSILCNIEVMNLIFDLQSTYLDIVRPLIKVNATGRKQPVLNPSLVSFEDSVSMKLHLIVDLGLYSGVGNQDLTVASLKLLGKLASSKKLNIQANSSLNQRLHGNRLIGIVDQNGGVASIANSLTLALQFDPRELSRGSDAPGWTIKSTILGFLIHCLSSFPERQTLAHALLGFTCSGAAVDVEADGTFANGQALFHAILSLVIDYPNGEDEMMQRWSLSLKQKGMQILSILWTSPLTSIFVLAEMRLRDALFLFFTRQTPVGPNTLWDGRSIMDPEFMYTESAEALERFLWQRCSIFEYVSTELRLIVAEGAPSMKARILSTLLGSTTTPQGEQIENMTVFDLLDFIELEASAVIAEPKLNYLAGIDFGLAAEAGLRESSPQLDIRLIHEMIILRLNDLNKSGRFQDSNEQQRADSEARHVLLYSEGRNNQLNIATARMQTIKAWADLLTLAIGTCDLGQGEKSALIIQTLQLVTPKLEDYAMMNVQEAKELARLILALLFQLDFDSSVLDQSRAGDVANDRLFQIFRTALRVVICPNVDIQLREVLYKICYQYLSGMSKGSDAPIRRRQVIQTLKSAGEKVMDTVCDDAYGASGTCRISALLLLDALASLATFNKSNHIIEALARTNFIQILVEGIESVPQELRNTGARDIPLLLTYYESKLALLLTISQSRAGATQVANAGLFSAIRASGLFAVDPDIGVEIDNPEALAKYYRLLLSIARIITSVVLTRGPQNEQTVENAKTFLTENRPLVVATFKRQARVGGVSFDDAGVDIEELVELFMLLIAMTDFLNYEEQRDTQRAQKVGVFT